MPKNCIWGQTTCDKWIRGWTMPDKQNWGQTTEPNMHNRGWTTPDKHNQGWTMPIDSYRWVLNDPSPRHIPFGLFDPPPQIGSNNPRISPNPPHLPSFISYSIVALWVGHHNHPSSIDWTRSGTRGGQGWWWWWQEEKPRMTRWTMRHNFPWPFPQPGNSRHIPSGLFNPIQGGWTTLASLLTRLIFPLSFSIWLRHHG